LPGAVHVVGLRELQAAFAKAERDSRLYLRAALREVAAPVQREAESLAESQIRRMPRSPAWAGMRIGVTRKLVYVAPKKRGVKAKGGTGRSRPNLADLLKERAMEPALDRHEGDLVGRVDAALDRVADHFNGGHA
jgi:alkanesulfonate monooxygenase SsuD/methylene tetrahydromethanopterin reductase-like flavin-dependent oxidoreductase (luciferase family)